MILLQIKKLRTLDTVYTLDLLSTKCSKLLQEAKKLSNIAKAHNYSDTVK